MSNYIHFTEEEIRQANSVDLTRYLPYRGETLLNAGREKRLKSNHSITIRGNEWYDHATETGGGAIRFLQDNCNMSFPEAVTELLLWSGTGPLIQPAPKEAPTVFTLPPAHHDFRRVYAYLVKHRNIDRDVVTAFVRARLIYEDAKYHNAVFVGRDEHGVARHAHKRSTNSGGKSFRQTVEGSDFCHAFHWLGMDEQLYVFEAPIDLLSYITLHPEDWKRHSYVACCGTSSLPVAGVLDRVSEIREVHLCLDNDKAGRQASQRLSEWLKGRGLTTDILVPGRKDWNEDLVTAITEPQLC